MSTSTVLLRRDAPNRSTITRFAIWELTRACDLACVHCRASAVRTVTRSSSRPRKEGACSVLVELIAHGAKAGLTMAVTPSGTQLMTRERLAEMLVDGSFAPDPLGRRGLRHRAADQHDTRAP